VALSLTFSQRRGAIKEGRGEVIGGRGEIIREREMVGGRFCGGTCGRVLF
jgi:hypothetical protein